MANQSPTFCKSMDVTDWDTDDIGVVADMLTCMDDGSPIGVCEKVGKAPHDTMRTEFANLKNKTVGDDVRVHFTAAHNVPVAVVLPYTSAVAVSVTNKITANAGDASPFTFVLTQAFMDDLHDLGSGKGAIRFTEDGGISGDVSATEWNTELNDAAADVAEPGHLASHYRRRSLAGITGR